jgi:hypothetical protein
MMFMEVLVRPSWFKGTVIVKDLNISSNCPGILTDAIISRLSRVSKPSLQYDKYTYTFVFDASVFESWIKTVSSLTKIAELDKKHEVLIATAIMEMSSNDLGAYTSKLHDDWLLTERITQVVIHSIDNTFESPTKYGVVKVVGRRTARVRLGKIDIYMPNQPVVFYGVSSTDLLLFTLVTNPLNVIKMLTPSPSAFCTVNGKRFNLSHEFLTALDNALRNGIPVDAVLALSD